MRCKRRPARLFIHAFFIPMARPTACRHMLSINASPPPGTYSQRSLGFPETPDRAKTGRPSPATGSRDTPYRSSPTDYHQPICMQPHFPAGGAGRVLVITRSGSLVVRLRCRACLFVICCWLLPEGVDILHPAVQSPACLRLYMRDCRQDIALRRPSI